MPIMQKNYILIIAIICSCMLFIQGCEDDPLLGPQISECAPGDSYCNSSLANEEEDTKNNNPETF